MTHIDIGKIMTTITMAANTLGLQRALKWLSDIRAKLATRKQYHATIVELSKLSDRELADIGMHRGMIHSVAMEVYYK